MRISGIFVLLLCFGLIVCPQTAQADILQLIADDSPPTAETGFDDDASQEEEFTVEGENRHHPKSEKAPFSEDQLTDRQKAFYWSSFAWMMEYGQPEEIKAFESKEASMLITYRTGDRFYSKNRRLCRTYALKLQRGEAESLDRSGIACQNKPKSWCRLREGKPEECRLDGPGEMDNLSNKLEIKQRNLSIGTERLFRGLDFGF